MHVIYSYFVIWEKKKLFKKSSPFRSKCFPLQHPDQQESYLQIKVNVKMQNKLLWHHQLGFRSLVIEQIYR